MLPFAALHAQQSSQGLNYSIGLSFEHSDNINQATQFDSITGQGPVSQDLLIPRLNFDWTQQGSTLQAQAVGQLEYRDYLQGDFNNEVRGNISGLGTWIIFPQRLKFDFGEFASVQPTNVFVSNAPNNQQQTNIFTLGPTLLFRLGEPLRGEADLHFTDTTASETKQFNSLRTEGAIRAIRDLNTTDQLSGNFSAEDVHFTDSVGAPDYKRYSIFARYVSKLSQVDMDVALGYSSLVFSDQPSKSGPLVRGNLTWRATPTNTFSLGVTRQYTDAAQDLMVSPAMLSANWTGNQVLSGSTPITSDVYLERSVEAGYSYQTARFNFRISPYYRNLNYSVVPLVDQINLGLGATDQTLHGGNLTADFRLRPLWTVGAFAHEETRNYTKIFQRDEDMSTGVYLSNRLSRHWSWRLDWALNKRASTEIGQSFIEHTVMATLTYTR